MKSHGIEQLPALVGKKCCVVLLQHYYFWQHGCRTNAYIAIGTITIAHGRVYVQRSPLPLDCAIEAIEIMVEEAE